jgi:hypothetical protein
MFVFQNTRISTYVSARKLVFCNSISANAWPPTLPMCPPSLLEGRSSVSPHTYACIYRSVRKLLFCISACERHTASSLQTSSKLRLCRSTTMDLDECARVCASVGCVSVFVFNAAYASSSISSPASFLPSFRNVVSSGGHFDSIPLCAHALHLLECLECRVEGKCCSNELHSLRAYIVEVKAMHTCVGEERYSARA